MVLQRLIIVAAAVTPASSATAVKSPRSVDYTQKSMPDLAGCIALQLAEARGYELSKAERSGATEFKLKFRVAGIAATAATILIADLGDRRSLTVYATGKSNGAPRVIGEKARACTVASAN